MTYGGASTDFCFACGSGSGITTAGFGAGPGPGERNAGVGGGVEGRRAAWGGRLMAGTVADVWATSAILI